MFRRAKSQEELAKLYSEADVTLILSRRETFSMVTAESLCCGTPVVGFKAGGPESIAIPEASIFVEYGEINSLVGALKNEFEVVNRQGISFRAKEIYSSESMAIGYLKLYES